MHSSLDRRARYDLAHFGEAIGDPSRAAMLSALMGGVARPASELARVAGVAPSTATAHLHRLEAAGLVVVRPSGRHRFYALAGEHVAHAVEELVGVMGAGARAPRTVGGELSVARTCYGHLAGRVAVAFWSRARERRWVRWAGDAVTLLPRGREVLVSRAVLEAGSRRTAGRACLDWSERVPHVSGPLGVAVCDGLLAARWLVRKPGERGLRVTARGAEGLGALGVRCDDGP